MRLLQKIFFRNQTKIKRRIEKIKIKNAKKIKQTTIFLMINFNKKSINILLNLKNIYVNNPRKCQNNSIDKQNKKSNKFIDNRLIQQQIGIKKWGNWFLFLPSIIIKKNKKKVKFISMHNRERPLQSSMFLPDHNSRRQTYEYTMQPNVLKKSSTFNNSEQVHHQPYFLSPQHITTSTPRPVPHDDSRENRGLPRSVDLMLGEIGEKVDKLTKIVDKHEYQINNQTINKADEITKIVLNQVRQNLPNFTTNSDVYEHIFNIKLDIKGLQEEVQRCVKENQFKKLETNLKDSMSENNKKLEKSLQNSQKAPQQEGVSGQLLKKRDDYFQKMINNLETQISFLKKSLQNHSLDLKVSPISSSSIIMLKYQQVFRARNKTQTDMVINQHTYYIDNEGYLLDSHSRYIVDQKGKKVRLEEKHITMLRNQQILQ